ncbi:DUF1488 family protein [Caballeronia glebae]|uniref:DUF1488 family protein n=1 Tax=Caballeronia glebae TaxID=1777143 RepID=UPI0038BC6392
MKEPACAPQISTDKHSVSFTLMWQGACVTCVILRATLESDFWLPSNADDIRMLQVFGDGFSRIEAIAYRKLRAHPVDLLELTSADFAKA